MQQLPRLVEETRAYSLALSAHPSANATLKQPETQKRLMTAMARESLNCATRTRLTPQTQHNPRPESAMFAPLLLQACNLLIFERLYCACNRFPPGLQGVSPANRKHTQTPDPWMTCRDSRASPRHLVCESCASFQAFGAGLPGNFHSANYLGVHGRMQAQAVSFEPWPNLSSVAASNKWERDP